MKDLDKRIDEMLIRHGKASHKARMCVLDKDVKKETKTANEIATQQLKALIKEVVEEVVPEVDGYSCLECGADGYNACIADIKQSLERILR